MLFSCCDDEVVKCEINFDFLIAELWEQYCPNHISRVLRKLNERLQSEAGNNCSQIIMPGGHKDKCLEFGLIEWAEI